MKTYWDHTEQERAKLTMGQVEKFLAYELMEQGVLAPEPLKLEEVAPVALPTHRTFLLREGDGNYGTILNVAFATIEQAEAARDALGFIREQQGGWKGPYFIRPVKALQIVTEDLPTEDTVTASRVTLDEAARRETANDQARRKFEEENKKASDATARIWSDWRECQRAEARHQKIRDTLADYERMTDGNAVLARAFLAKAFPADLIAEAIPEPECLPAPEEDKP